LLQTGLQYKPNLKGTRMTDNFSTVEQRVMRYWYTDGLGELTGGGMFMLLGGYFAGQEFLKANDFVSGLLQGSLVLVLVGGMFFGRWLIKLLKSRLTYPRTGYVEYRVDKDASNLRRILIGIVAAVVAVSTLMFSKQVGYFLDLTIALTGMLVGLILIVMQGKRSDLKRFYVLGGFSFVLGIVLALSGLPDGYGLGAYYGLMGLAYIISGSFVLRRYLQENPMPVERP
jgi:hypothetical protein